MRATLCVLFALFIILVSGFEYQNEQQLVDSEGTPWNYTIQWTIEGDAIRIRASAKTTGWIGFGISPQKTMVGSDVIIAWVNGAQQFFADRYAVQYSEPVLDIGMTPPGQENCQLISLAVSPDGWTTVEYSRLLDTGDQWDVPITAGPLAVVWAMGYDGDNPTNGKIQRHQYRAVNTITFYNATNNHQIPTVLTPTCNGANDRRVYSGDSSSVASLRVETLAGNVRLANALGTHINAVVLESAYDSTMKDTIQTNFFSGSPGYWGVASQRGDASDSSPSSSSGPSPKAPVINSVNDTIGELECVASDISVTIPTSNTNTRISGYTHQGDVLFPSLSIGNSIQVSTDQGRLKGVLTLSSTVLNITTELTQLKLQVEKRMDFSGVEYVQVVISGFSGTYKIKTSSSNSVKVTGEMVTPLTGTPNSEEGYVGYKGAVASFTIQSSVNVEIAFFQISDAETFDVTMPNFLIPPRRTSYICTPFTLPDEMDTHIIRIDPIVDNSKVLHHMVLFMCDQKQTQSEPWDCSTMDPECVSILYVWAVGGSNFYLPQEAGFLMGPNGAHYGVLQVHYDNPDHLATARDSSGLRLYYTPDLREHNAAILEIGINYYFSIPPGQKAYQLGEPKYGCPKECSTKNIPSGQPLTVFASLLHAHLAGRQIWTEHYHTHSNGTVTRNDDLGNNPYYDFNVQEYILFDPPRQMFPSDSLITYCVYDTTDRTTDTYFGLSTLEEMCFNFVAYYPAGAWDYCFGLTDHVATCDGVSNVISWGNIPPTVI